MRDVISRELSKYDVYYRVKVIENNPEVYLGYESVMEAYLVRKNSNQSPEIYNTSYELVSDVKLEDLSVLYRADLEVFDRVWMNKKNTSIYFLQCVGINATNSNDGDIMVIYERDGNIYTREINEFIEKFVKVSQ